jgi:hypothetical protein
MKKLLLTAACTCIVVLMTCLPAKGAQLSGTYTIDSAGTPSTTVFADFNSAIIYLTGSGTRPDGGPSNSSPFGVNGAVTFEVMQGTYTEQVSIPAITGASATNTVRFDGGAGNASSRVLRYVATSTTDGHTLRFSACQYVTVANLTIVAAGTSQGLGVHFYGACSYNTLKQCSVIVATSSSTNFRAINCSGSTVLTSGGGCSAASPTSALNNIYIDSNYVSGGYYGIFLNSSAAGSGSYNFYIRWNQLYNAYLYQIAASGSYGYLIFGNHIKPTAQTSSQGIYHCNGNTGSQQSYQIVNNTFENCGAAGITTLTNNPAANIRSKIAQNYFKPTFISATAQAMNINYFNNSDIWHNTILMNQGGGTGIMLQTSGSNIDIRNNIIMLTSASATGVCLNAGASVTLTQCNNNVYIKNNPASPDIVIVGGSAYTASNFKGAGGFNTNSTTEDPLLVSPPDDIRPNNICQKGAALTMNVPVMGTINTDYYGNARSTPPQIGAAEPGSGLGVDISAVSFILPVQYPVTAGSQDIKLLVKNAGNSAITFYNASAQLGSTTVTVTRSSVNIPACGFDTVVFDGSNQLTLNTGSNYLRAWVDNPNFSVDSNMLNDTISNTFCTPIQAGTYTIDSGGTGDFISFSEVADLLNCGGIDGTGPVVFNVARGTFYEQVSLVNVRGVSATSNIVFQSADNNADSVMISGNGTDGNFVVKMVGMSYTTWRGITLRATVSSAGRVFDLSGNITTDTIEGCNLISTSTSTTADANAIIYANSIIGGRHVINNNRLSYGSFGIYLRGVSTALVSDSNRITNNTVASPYYAGIYCSYTPNIVIRDNVYTGGNYASSYGIYVTSSYNAIEISGNRISGQVGAYGIYNSSNVGTSTRRGMIFNNTVAGGTTGTYYALYTSGCQYQSYLHNSFYATTTGTTSYGGYFQYTSASQASVMVRNNVFANKSAGSANYAIYVYNPAYADLDYNDLYTGGANLVNQANPTATTYANIDAWRAASTYDKHSVSYKPGFMSNTDLTPNPADSNSWVMNGRGIHLSGNVPDFNGNPRPATPADGVPDLGAFEFTPTADPPIAVASPATPTAGTTQVFTFAGDTVATIEWDQFSSPPATIEVRQFAGVMPPHIWGAPKYMYYYDSIVMPYAFYNYNLKTYYRDSWMGTMPSETQLRFAKYINPNWTVYTGTGSSVDTVLNFIYGTGFYEDNMIVTGSDDTEPLPVQLAGGLRGNKAGNDVLLNWNTASEINSQVFVVEVSTDGNKFSDIGRVASAHNSSTLKQYEFIHTGAFAGYTGTLYYRLRMVDMDGSFTWSNRISLNVGRERGLGVSATPNPFINYTSVMLSSELATDATVTVTDLRGRTVLTQPVKLKAGFTKVDLLPMQHENEGLYFVTVSADGRVYSLKLLKAVR